MTRRAIPQDIYGDTAAVALVRGEIAWDAERGILRMGDGATPGGQEFYPAGVQHVSLRATMAGLPVRGARVVSVTQDESLWEWRVGNYAAAAASDPLHGLYQPHATIAVSAGCWVRRWDGLHGRPEWFGAQVNNGAFDCLPALNACVALCPVTLLQRADYWISGTWKINTPWRSIVGQGNISYLTGQGTRILVTSGTATVMQIGADDNPGGEVGVTYLRQVYVENLTLTRSIANVPNVDINANPIGCRINYTYRCSFRNVAAWESNIGFQLYGCVYTKLHDCLAFRSPAGGTANANIFYGFHLIGSPAILAGGNASLYLIDCAANASGIQNFGISAGFRAEGAFVDSFLEWPETYGAKVGIWAGGTGPDGDFATNIDLQIEHPVVDQPYEIGLFLDVLAPTAMVQVNEPYVGMNGSATSGIYVGASQGLVTITAGQVAATGGAGDPIGLYIKDSSGVKVGGLKLTNLERPVAMDTALRSRIEVLINNRDTIASGDGAIVLENCDRIVLEPHIEGVAGAFPAGVVLVGTDNDHIKVDCTLIDPACITGGATNKLVANDNPVTATGTFDTNCLASGIMS